MRPKVRRDLAGQEPYGAPIAEVPVRLNVNENPYAPPAEILEEISAAVGEALVDGNRYPDREAENLRQAICDYLGHGITPDQVWAANGSNEIMHQVFSAFGGPGRVALSFSPTYSMYPQYARDTHTAFRTEPRNADFSLDPAAAVRSVRELEPAIVVVASPNNPTGHLLDPGALAVLLTACESVGALLVVDEAYAEFADPTLPTALSLVGNSPNLLVTRTLSKSFGLAGLRLGYAVGAAGLIDSLRVVRLPYHLSSATQAAATVAFRNADRLLERLPGIRSERIRMMDWAARSGLRLTPSQGNFLLVGQFRDRHAVWQTLLDRGVLVRESGPDGWLRVSVGTPEENDLFMTALTGLLQETPTALSGGARGAGIEQGDPR